MAVIGLANSVTLGKSTTTPLVYDTYDCINCFFFCLISYLIDDSPHLTVDTAVKHTETEVQYLYNLYCVTTMLFHEQSFTNASLQL